ncbi:MULTISPECIES: hypothetical protein [Nitrosopumilus]|nr:MULTISPECIES: hypothetical protein [Nitrosopumilus]
MGIVIAFIIVVAGFVGYHASQDVPEYAEEHNISSELNILDANIIDPIQKQIIVKSIV